MSTSRKLRRIEVRRQKSELREPWLKRLRRDIGLATPSVGLAFFALTCLIVLYGHDPFPYRDGMEVREPIFARVLVEDVDENDTRRARLEARKNVPNIYTLNTGLIERVAGAMTNMYVAVQAQGSYDAYVAQFESQAEVTDRGIMLDQAAFDALHDQAGDEGRQTFQRWVEELTKALKHHRLIRNRAEEGRDPPSQSTEAVLVGALPAATDRVSEDGSMVIVDKVSLDYFDVSNLRRVETVADDLATKRAIFPMPVRRFVRETLVNILQSEALFKFDLNTTLARMDREAGQIHETKVNYPPDTVLARSPDSEHGHRPGEVYRLSPQQVKLLQYQHNKILRFLDGDVSEDEEEQLLAAGMRRQQFYIDVGRAALVALVILGMIAYCGLFQPRVIRKPLRALSVALLFVLMLVTSRALFLTGLAVTYPMVLVGPIVMSAAILTMVYDQRFAIGMTAALAFLITIAVRGDLGMMMVLATSMAVVVYQFREIRSRNELFSTGLLNGLAAFIAALTAGLVAGQTPHTAVSHGLFAAISAVLAIAILFLFLSPIERIFKVATNWTLLELLDTSKQLLSRLAQEAPGTYNHSLWLSAMAEDACEAIGANGLLAKVGAMYHDIGKIQKPEYFAENQQAQINRHDKLAPTLSLLVIVGHVKDGVEMAKEYGLPPSIIRFIEEHHGTTVVRYFHHAASAQQRASGEGREVPESEFRYPGPKPQSRETAVLMLCDGVEGAVRALPEPTAGRIENVVHSVLMDRLNDGQFNDCDITLRELHRVEQSLVKSLCRFYHGRVPYPRAHKTGTGA